MRKPSKLLGRLRMGIATSCQSTQNGSISEPYAPDATAKVAEPKIRRRSLRRETRLSAAGAAAGGAGCAARAGAAGASTATPPQATARERPRLDHTGPPPKNHPKP